MVVFSPCFIPMPSSTMPHGSQPTYAWDPASVELGHRQTPVQNGHVSGALPWSYAQNPARRTSLFSFSVEIFPPASADLKGTTSSHLYPCRTYPNNTKEVRLSQKPGKFSGFLLLWWFFKWLMLFILSWRNTVLSPIWNCQWEKRGGGKHI